MVSICTERYIKSNGKSFKEGTEIIIKHKDGREIIGTIETIANNWIEVTTDDETLEINISNIVSIYNN